MLAMNDNIRHAVKVELAKRRMTQGELASRVGITPQHLSRMMHGKGGNLRRWQDVLNELGLEVIAQPRNK